MPEGTTSTIKFNREELSFLVKSQFAIRRATYEREKLGGVGEVFAISHLLHCKELIILLTKIAALAYNDSRNTTIKKAQLQTYIQEFRAAHPLPDFIKSYDLNELTHDLPIHELTFLHRHFKSKLTAEDFFGTILAVATPTLCTYMQTHMNLLLEYVSNQCCENLPTKELTTFLLIKYPATLIFPSPKPTYRGLIYSASNVLDSVKLSAIEKNRLHKWLHTAINKRLTGSSVEQPPVPNEMPENHSPLRKFSLFVICTVVVSVAWMECSIIKVG